MRYRFVLLVAFAVAACGRTEVATDVVDEQPEPQEVTETPEPEPTATATTIPDPPVSLPPPEGARLRLGRGRVYQAAVSPDGELLAIITTNGLFMYHTDQMREMWRIPGTHQQTSAMTFSPDGRTVVYSHSGIIHLANAGTGEQILELEGLSGHNINEVTYAPDGLTLAAASSAEEVIMWDITTGEQQIALEGHAGGVASVDFSPDGERLVSGGNDDLVKIWDVESGQRLLTLRGHSNAIHAVAFAPDGQTLASGSRDRTAIIWDAETGEQEAVLESDGVLFYDIDYAPDGQTLAGGVSDGSIRIWDVETGAEINRLSRHTSLVKGVSFSVDGASLLSYSWDDRVILWDVSTGEQQATVQDFVASINQVAYGPDGNRLVATSEFSKVVSVWDTVSGELLLTLEGHESRILSVAYAPQGGQIATGAQDGTIIIWDAITGDQVAVLDEHTDDVLTLAFSWDGNMLFSSSADNQYIFWDAQNWEVIGQDEGLTPFTTAAAAAGDSVLATGDAYGNIISYNFGAIRAMAVMKANSEEIRDLTLSSNGHYLASVNGSREAYVWDPISGTQILALGQSSDATQISISPDGSMFVTAGRFGKCALWDTATGEQLVLFRAANAGLDDISFSTDGLSIITVARDGTGTIWDVADLLDGQGPEGDEAEEEPSSDPGVVSDGPTPTESPLATEGLISITRNREWAPIVEVFNEVEMAFVPRGCFMMGSEDGDDDERPVHEVCFEEPFWIDVLEVTNDQYGETAEDCTAFSADSDEPRICVNWSSARAHCESRDARLPTEAEWEYAARGPDGWTYPWGNEYVAANIVISSRTGDNTRFAGSIPGGKSWVGAYDMIGNVWEWLNDWYAEDYYRGLPEPAINPQGPESGEERVLRGGGFRQFDPFMLRAAKRGHIEPGYSFITWGFRCARDDD